MSDYLDPTDSVAVPRRTAPRPASLDGKVITLLDISKAKGDHWLDRVEQLLTARTWPQAIVRKKKPTFARPAPEPLRQEIVGATEVVVIVAVIALAQPPECPNTIPPPGREVSMPRQRTPTKCFGVVLWCYYCNNRPEGTLKGESSNPCGVCIGFPFG